MKIDAEKNEEQILAGFDLLGKDRPDYDRNQTGARTGSTRRVVHWRPQGFAVSVKRKPMLHETHDTRILDVADRILNLVDGRIVSDVAVKETVVIAEFLQKCPLFAQQPATMLTEFAERMKRESFETGEALIRRGEIGDKFYVIESGTVDVTGEKDGVPFQNVNLGKGDFFGGVALLTGASRNATVMAREPVEVFTLAKEHFDQALRRSKTLEERLREVWMIDAGAGLALCVVPIPNTEVKRCSLDGSATKSRARVGRRKNYARNFARKSAGLLSALIPLANPNPQSAAVARPYCGRFPIRE